jgi:hypothetical protein
MPGLSASQRLWPVVAAYLVRFLALEFHESHEAAFVEGDDLADDRLAASGLLWRVDPGCAAHLRGRTSPRFDLATRQSDEVIQRIRCASGFSRRSRWVTPRGRGRLPPLSTTRASPSCPIRRGSRRRLAVGAVNRASVPAQHQDGCTDAGVGRPNKEARSPSRVSAPAGPIHGAVRGMMIS